MARQNVGNPKFYIDLPSYFMAKGIAIDMTEPKVFGLNPSDVHASSTEIGRLVWANYDIEIDRIWRLSADNDANFFFGILGHNFYKCNGYKPTVQLINNNSIVHTMENWDEICNFPIYQSVPEQNGWSLGNIDVSSAYAYDFDKIRFRFAGDGANVTQDVMVLIGSFAFGNVYQMPHSPDLKLTMSREYDGISQQTTRGGSTVTQINYSRPPDWAGYPSWGLTTNNVDSYLNNPPKWFGGFPSSGRRIWDLKFSYISGNELFPLNEMLETQNPTDSSTNSAAGYDILVDGVSTDFHTDGNFIANGMQDWSFMNIVINGTIGGSLRFVFQPDGNNNSPDQFAICQLDQDSIKFKQVAHNVYDVSLKIREVW